jgi:prepilin-type processing-associated H-X9-DG protein
MNQQPDKPASCAEKAIQAALVVVFFAFAGISAFPLYMHQRGERTNICGSNMKQLSLAFAMYTQDYDGRLPAGVIGDGSGLGWASEITPYLKDVSVYHCDLDPTTGDNSDTNELYAVSYALNSNIDGRNTSVASAVDETVVLFEVSGDSAAVTDPSEAGLPGHQYSASGNGLDGELYSLPHGGTGAVKYATGYLGGRPTMANTQFESASGRHGGGANYAFLDSHVQWILPDDVSSGTNAARPAESQKGVLFGAAIGTGNPASKATFSLR